jgi:hypothetical protein
VPCLLLLCKLLCHKRLYLSKRAVSEQRPLQSESL